MTAVTANNLRKKYGTVPALSDVGFTVEQGTLFGVIGPDGAGKTTLLRILATLLLADSGAAIVDGCDVVKDFRALRRRIGYMPGRFSLYQDLTVEENLNVFATVFGTTIQENYHLIEDIYCQIEPFKKRRAGALSGGMKQKLALCCALIHKPSVLILDEPTTGVDPVSRRDLWEMLGRLKKQGITIIVSTPYMDEAARCDTIALMRTGRFLALDTPRGITGSYQRPLWSIRGAAMSRLLTDIRPHPAVASCFAFGDTHHATITDATLQPSDLQMYLQQRGHADVSITPIVAGIEDCFMELMFEHGDAA